MSGAGFLIIVVAFAFLWFVLVRPQKKRQVAQQRMLQELHVGDEVLTAGGMYGRVTKLDDEVVTVEAAPGLELRIARRAIAGVTRDEPAETVEEPAEEPAEESPPGD